MVHALIRPLREPQTYRNLAYLALALPLGLVELAFLGAGLALGLVLLITWFGLPVLLGTLGGSFALARVERRLAARLLGARIAVERPAAARAGAGVAGRLRTTLCCRTTWRRLGFLAAKLPLATVTFALAFIALALSVALLSAPLTYAEGDAPLALAAGAAGVAALPLALHLVNALAGLWARVGRALLPAAA